MDTRGEINTKILIANRGEIARRIGQTCRRMGIAVAALYTEEEKGFAHIIESNEAYSLGEGTAHETYLNGEKIVALAKKAKAWGIHPGYGFLSESDSFAQMVEDEGLVFIGPSPSSMKLMGDKNAAKQTAEKLGIPVLPGYSGKEQGAKQLLSKAQAIGFPLLIKAAKGGGGKGMRLVGNEGDFARELVSAVREAKGAFGDGRVLLEKYISSPRHIEVQIIGDQQGKHLHLFERECSIQRSYQKIIEESPAPGLEDDMRENLYRDALKIARYIDYVGVGTVEFILDGEGNYYFLEMNTRLQVEHPVTEMVLGLDLVQWQIEVASGQALEAEQWQLTPRGHAIEARLCAEDGDNNFLPSSGTIVYLGRPAGLNLRFDTGYRDGDAVGVKFDSLLGKIIAWGATRKEAIATLSSGLEEVPALGIKSNRGYLAKILAHPKFVSGDLSTSFIKDYQKDLLKRAKLTREQKAQILGAFFLGAKGRDKTVVGPSSDCWERLVNFSNV